MHKLFASKCSSLWAPLCSLCYCSNVNISEAKFNFQVKSSNLLMRLKNKLICAEDANRFEFVFLELSFTILWKLNLFFRNWPLCWQLRILIICYFKFSVCFCRAVILVFICQLFNLTLFCAQKIVNLGESLF